jgi:hypothetical protein
MYTEQLTQALGFCTEVDAQVINNATKTTGGIDMSKFHRALFILNMGAVAGGGSINAALQESADNVTFTALAGNNVSVTGQTTANKLITFEVRSDQLTKRYVRLSVTETGSQNVNVCVIGFGAEAVQKPGSAQNAATIASQQVVS